MKKKIMINVEPKLYKKFKHKVISKDTNMNREVRDFIKSFVQDG